FHRVYCATYSTYKQAIFPACIGRPSLSSSATLPTSAPFLGLARFFTRKPVRAHSLLGLGHLVLAPPARAAWVWYTKEASRLIWIRRWWPDARFIFQLSDMMLITTIIRI